MKKNAIFLCNEFNEKTGWGIINHNYLKYFSNKLNIDVFTSIDSKNTPIKKIKNVRKILNKPNNFFFSLRLIKIILFILMLKKKKIKYLFVLIEPYAYYIPLFKLLLGCKVYYLIVGTYSTVYLKKNNFLKSYYLYSLSFIDEFISISEYSCGLFKKYTKNKISDKDIKIIYPGINFEKKKFNRKRKNQFISIGHIKERKGTIYLLKAFSKFLTKVDKSYKLILVGSIDSIYGSKCLKFIKENNLSNNVIIKTDLNQKKIKFLISQSIAHFLISTNIGNDYEGFGIVHIESNLLYTPSVGCYNCGNESAINNNINGFLIRQKNVEQIFKKMKYFSAIKNTNKWDKIALSSYKHSEDFDWSKQLNKSFEFI